MAASGVKKEVDSLARPYQLELLEAALEENTIVNLGTGAGKTFIAVMLIKELSSQIRQPFCEDGSKRTIFLVTTVPLVKQQANYIAIHTHLNVGQYIGEMGVDNWPLSRWNKQFETNHVLVMTMTIFKNLILRNILKFSQVNLLIFDECHHAVKNHEYVQIMRRYKDGIDTLYPTRILGLTASLIPSKCKLGDLTKKIEDLENTLCSRAQTAEDMAEVAKFATNPDEECLYFTPSYEDCNVVQLKKILDELLQFLEKFPKEMKLSSTYAMVKLNFEDCLHILVNLGIWCAHQFSVNALEDITTSINEYDNLYNNKAEEMLIHLGRTKMSIFERESRTKTTVDSNRIHMTDKVDKLLIQFGNSSVACGAISYQGSPALQNSSGGGGGNLRGIIFTERRTTAVLLRNLLQKQSKEAYNLRHIKCDCVVGHNDARSGTYLRREAKMKIKKQEDILDKFRRGSINLLVSTSVVEEGVDVPKCNMVIRFDFPQNLRSYVQSKGRARAKVSKYILLIPIDEASRLHPQLKEYNSLVDELQLVCHSRHVADEEDILAQLKDLCKPYENNFGAKATINSSLAIVHRYCQKLPKDSYTILSPDFKSQRRKINNIFPPSPYRIRNQKEEFLTVLTLPMSSPLREPIEGEWFPTKRLADKSSALCAVKKLDEEGELDRHLKPNVKDEDSDDDGDDDLQEERKKPNAGTERRTGYYPNTVAPDLSGCFPVYGSINYLYIFVITEATTGYMYLSRNENIDQLSFGILCSKPLPYLKIPEYSIYEEDKELHVKICEYHSTISLDLQEIEMLKRAHQAIFCEVLKIRPSWLNCVFEHAEKNYLVIPIQVIPPEIYSEASLLQVYIDIESAKLLASMVPSSQSFPRPADSMEPVEWPISVGKLNNTIIIPNHNNKQILHEVLEVSETINLSSPFPDMSVASTYLEYFTKKYKCCFTDCTQPALKCRVLGCSSSYLQLLTSRFKSSVGKDTKKSSKRGRTIELFPELCSFYPLPANMWKLIRCLPSLLWRVECILTVDALHSRISIDTGIGLLPDGSELTTHTNFRGYKDMGFGDLSTQKYILGQQDQDISQQSKPEMITLCVCNPLDPPLRSPDNALMLQALTTKSAGDSVNLERLETLGDSFLKFSTTIFLFFDRFSDHEGRLTSARSRRVGNFNLYYLAKCRGIPKSIFSSTFDPRQMWVPPCFVFREDKSLQTTSDACQIDESVAPSQDDELATASAEESGSFVSDHEKHYLFHKLTDKGVADCMESLIGVYLVSGGILAGLKVMVWMGIKIGTKQELDEARSTSEEGEIKDDIDLTPYVYRKIGLKTKPSLLDSRNSYAHPPCAKQPKRTVRTSSLFVRDSSAILTNFFRPPPWCWISDRKHKQVELNRLLNIAVGEKDLIGWKFNDRRLLLQALTHASYTKNRLTDSYQRLEFLGDAVLDYLITCHIYSTFPEYGPGKITSMRSALVNNITFAEMAVEMKLHSAILYNSPYLFKQLELYLNAVKRFSLNGDTHCDDTVFYDASSSVNEEDQISGSSSAVGDADDCIQDEEEVEEIDPPKVLGDILESLAGAVFIDSGLCLESVWSVFQPYFDRKIETFKGNIPIGPIQELQHLEPSAKSESKKEGPRKVRCTITVLRKSGTPPLCVSALANTKTAAKTAAARLIVQKLKKEQDS